MPSVQSVVGQNAKYSLPRKVVRYSRLNCTCSDCGGVSVANKGWGDTSSFDKGTNSDLENGRDLVGPSNSGMILERGVPAPGTPGFIEAWAQQRVATDILSAR